MQSGGIDSDICLLSLREQAECLWMLTACGLAEIGILTDWADQQIRLQDQPHFAMIQLALIKPEQFEDARAYIGELPGHLHADRIAMIVIRQIREALQRDKLGAEQVIERLMLMCNRLELPEKVDYEIDRIDDDRHLEAQGVWDDGTTQKSVIDFLNTYSAPQAWRQAEPE